MKTHPGGGTPPRPMADESLSAYHAFLEECVAGYVSDLMEQAECLFWTLC